MSGTRFGGAARRPAAGASSFLLGALIAATGTGADAQTAPDAPAVISPLHVESDVNDVNLVTGRTVLKTPTLSVPAAPNLKFDWVQNAAPYVSGTVSTSSDIGGSSPADGSYSVHTGTGTSESFRCPDYDCSAVNGGGTLTGTGSTFVPIANRFRQGGTGALYRYNLKHVDLLTAGTPFTSGKRTILYYASEIDFPTGETITYSYDTATDPSDTYNRTWYRPNRVTSSLGYYITITYQTGDFSQNGWGVPAQATLYAASDPATPLGRLTYSGTTVTDLAGRTFTCTGCGGALGADLETAGGSLRLPGEAVPAVQVNPSAQTSSYPMIGSVVKDGVAWTYSYANPSLPFGQNNWVYDSVTVTGPNGYHETFNVTTVAMTVYSRQLILKRSTDSLGRQTSYQFDAAMRPVQVTLPEGNKVDLTYDEWGNVISKTTTPKPGSGQVAVTETAWVDATNCANTGAPVLCYRPVYTLDAAGRQTDYIYNSAGQVKEKTEPADANGVRRKTYITYETSLGLSRPSVIRVCGLGTTCGTANEIRTEYIYWGGTMLPLTESHIDAAAGVTLTTTYSYDAAGRPLMVDGPLPGTDDADYFRYDVLGRKTWEIGPNGANYVRAAKRFTYRDADDKATIVESGTVPPAVPSPPALPTLTLLERSDAGYDAHRNPVREAVSAPSAPGGPLTTYALTERSFDDRGQLVCQAQRMNAAAFGAVTDGCTLGSQGSYGPDRITHNLYDAAGQLSQVQRAYGVTVANGFPATLQQNYATYDYTPNGKQKAVTDANNNRAELSWDGFDRQRRWIFPSPTTPNLANQADYEEYGYDALGNRTSLRKRDTVTLSYAYDGMNRLTQKSVPASATGAAGYSVYYGYDVNGLQLYARFGSAAGPGIATAYDGFGRVTSTTSTMDGVYRTLSSQYDAAGNRTGLSGNDGYHAGWDYDAAGRVTFVRNGAGTPIIQLGYTPRGQRSFLWVLPAISSSTGYGYDDVGRLNGLGLYLAGTSADQIYGFSYNAANQIVTRTSTNDAYASNTAYNVSRPYSVNGLNQYTAAGGAPFTYDLNGNLTSAPDGRGGTNSYVYDAENRLVSASVRAADGTITTPTLAYDPNGRLWQVTGASGTTHFLYDGDRVIEEMSGTGQIQRGYIHGPGADEPLLWSQFVGTVANYYLHADHQGSIVALADESGNPFAVNAYDAWGIPNETNQGRFGYTGQAWLPELGMWYYKARFYSPTLGRFLQTDPVGYKDQVNLYAYVGDDPANHTDSAGTQTVALETQREAEIEDLRAQGMSREEINAQLIARAQTNAGLLTLFSSGAEVYGIGAWSYRAFAAWRAFTSAERAIAAGRLVLYSGEVPANLAKGDVVINLKAGWTLEKNDRLINSAIRQGRAIRDSFVDKAGRLINAEKTSVLSRERDQLRRAGYQFNSKTSEWTKPTVCIGSRLQASSSC